MFLHTNIFLTFLASCFIERVFKLMDDNGTRVKSYYERASAASERSLFNITENFSMRHERPGPARPETLLRGLYLSNHLADSLAVFFIL